MALLGCCGVHEQASASLAAPQVLPEPSASVCVHRVPTHAHCLHALCTPTACTPAPGLGAQASTGAPAAACRGRRVGWRLQPWKEMKHGLWEISTFFTPTPHPPACPRAPIGSHLPPSPTRGTSPALHAGSWAMAVVGPRLATQRCWDGLGWAPSWPRAPQHHPTGT